MNTSKRHTLLAVLAVLAIAYAARSMRTTQPAIEALPVTAA